MPAIWTFERGDKLGGARLAKAGLRWPLKAIRHHPINATEIVPAVQVEKFFQVVGQRPRVFDRLAVHVDDVKCAVRSVGKLHGPKPGISRGNEFGQIFTRPALRFEAGTVQKQNLTMNEIAAGITNEGIVQVFTWKRIAA